MGASLHADWIDSASACCRDNRPPTPSWPCADASMKPLHSLTLLSPSAHGSATQNPAIVAMQDTGSQTDQPHACVRWLHCMCTVCPDRWKASMTTGIWMRAQPTKLVYLFFFFSYSHRAPDIPNLLSLETVWVCVHVCASLCWLVEFCINPICCNCDMTSSCRSPVPRNLEKMPNLRTSWFNFHSGWKPTQREASLLPHSSVRKVHFLKSEFKVQFRHFKMK